MQNIYYIDSNFSSENSTQYILSIRYSTDGFSFCVHDSNNKLLVFFHQPLEQNSNEAIIAKASQIISDDPILNLKYKKVFVLSCQKNKMLLPAHAFYKNTLIEMFRLCFELHESDTLIYKKIEAINSYLIEALPRNFINFLSSRYQTISIIDSSYPFIIYSMSSMLFNAHYLFIDIHEEYFDILLTHSNNILLFNSFSYGSVNDIIYYSLNCLQQCQVNQNDLQTTISGNLVNDPTLVETMNRYIPNIAILNYAPLSQLVKNNQLNNSIFIHLLNIHKCE